MDVRPHPEVTGRRLDDELVLVQLRTNRVYRLNRTGARFWELLTDGLPRHEIEKRLRKEFDVGRDQLAAEIDTLLRELRAAELVVEAAA